MGNSHNKNEIVELNWFVNNETHLLHKMINNRLGDKLWSPVHNSFDENGKELYFNKETHQVSSKNHNFDFNKKTRQVDSKNKNCNFLNLLNFNKKTHQVDSENEIRVFRSYDEKTRNENIRPVQPRTIRCQDSHGNSWDDIIWC
jgi:hypothetical protein